MPEKSRPPPAPGPVVRPNLAAIEEAVRDVTFPISRRDLVEQIREDDSVILAGRNVDLRSLVRSIADDFFETEDEFRDALERAYADDTEGAEAIVLPFPPTGFPESMPLDAPGASDQPAVPDDNA